jgi:hypothetical protein
MPCPASLLQLISPEPNSEIKNEPAILNEIDWRWPWDENELARLVRTKKFLFALNGLP